MTDHFARPKDAASKGLHMMWAIPRSRSTAFLRMMIERGDFLCLHEPFCALRDLGSVELKTSSGAVRRLTEAHAVVDHILELSESTKVFVKETTDHSNNDIFGSDLFSQNVKTTLMIRAPERTVASHLRKSPSATIDQVGYGAIVDIGNHLIERGTPFHIIESEVLVRQPAVVIEEYCRYNLIPFLDRSLKWKRGHRPEWSRAQHWHDEVAETSGFQSEEVSYPPFEGDLQETASMLTQMARVDYDRLILWRDQVITSRPAYPRKY